MIPDSHLPNLAAPLLPSEGMATIELDNHQLEEIRNRIIHHLWNGSANLTDGIGLSVPNITTIVRVDEEEALRVINQPTIDMMTDGA